MTLILLPLGIPLFGLALRMYAYGVKLMLPRDVLPSPEDLGKGARQEFHRTRQTLSDLPPVRSAKRTAKKPRKLSDSLTRALWRDALR